MKKLLGILGLALLGTLAVILGRAFLLRAPADEPVAPAATSGAQDVGGLASRLAGAVRFPTVSHQDPGQDDAAVMSGFGAYLAASYPRVYGSLLSETVGGASLLFTWPGTDPSLSPVLLLSHMDVVPMSPGTEKDWQHAPFSGDIEDGYIWGRGTLDDKSGVLGLLEAADQLLKQNFQPRRTVYFAFGHDEEVGGNNGAGKISALLKSRGVRPEYILDEGGVISVGLLGGLSRPAAMIGIAEKGYLTVELTVDGEGGHSSTPPKATSIGRLASAVARLEARPMPSGVTGALKAMLLTLAPEMSFGRRVAIANLWLFEPLLTRLLGQTDVGRASLGTTVATTIFQSGDKDNVLPAKARAVVNLRLLPGDTVEAALKHMLDVIDDDSVKITPLPGGRPASQLSDPSSPSYKALARAVRETYADTAASPYLTIGGTDSVHYEELSPQVFRFLPVHFKPDDMPRFHGTNERISIDDYAQAVRFYARLIKDTAQ